MHKSPTIHRSTIFKGEMPVFDADKFDMKTRIVSILPITSSLFIFFLRILWRKTTDYFHEEEIVLSFSRWKKTIVIGAQNKFGVISKIDIY